MNGTRDGMELRKGRGSRSSAGHISYTAGAPFSGKQVIEQV